MTVTLMQGHSGSAKAKQRCIQANYSADSETEEVCLSFKQGLQEATQKFVPHRTPNRKPSHPWIDYEVEKLIRGRDRLYKRLNTSRDQDLAATVKKIKHGVQRKARGCCWKYVNNLVSDNTADKQSPR